MSQKHSKSYHLSCSPEQRAVKMKLISVLAQDSRSGCCASGPMPRPSRDPIGLEAACIGRHNSVVAFRAHYRAAQAIRWYICMAAAARILRTSHLLIILLSNLAAANLAANLSIAVPGVANLLFLTPQLQYGLAGQTWVSRASPRCCRANGQGSPSGLPVATLFG